MYREDITPIQVGRVRKWIEALRSGNYSQCRMSYKNEDSFCWVGLGAEVSRLGTWVTDPLVSEALPLLKELYYVNNISWGTQNVLDFYGLTEDLVTANDKGVSFKKLGDVMEAKLNSHLESIGLVIPEEHEANRDSFVSV